MHFSPFALEQEERNRLTLLKAQQPNVINIYWDLYIFICMKVMTIR